MSGRKILAWLAMLGIAAILVLSTLVWTVASHRMPDDAAPIGEERYIGFFDPHLHGRLVEVSEVSALPEAPAPSPGLRRVWARVEVRSSAAELLLDPSKLGVFVDTGLERHYPLRSVGEAIRLDDVDIRRRFTGPLETEESQQAWFVFDLPEGVESAELWLSRDSWAIRMVPWLEGTPLWDKAVFEVELDREE